MMRPLICCLSLLLPASLFAGTMLQVARLNLSTNTIDYSERRELIRTVDSVLDTHGYEFVGAEGENSPRLGRSGSYTKYYAQPKDSFSASMRVNYSSLRIAVNRSEAGDQFEIGEMLAELQRRLKSRIPSARINTWISQDGKGKKVSSKSSRPRPKFLKDKESPKIAQKDVKQEPVPLKLDKPDPSTMLQIEDAGDQGADVERSDVELKEPNWDYVYDEVKKLEKSE